MVAPGIASQSPAIRTRQPPPPAKAIRAISMEKTMSSETNAKKAVSVTGRLARYRSRPGEDLSGRGYRVVANSRNINKSNGLPPPERLALVDDNIAEFV